MTQINQHASFEGIRRFRARPYEFHRIRRPGEHQTSMCSGKSACPTESGWTLTGQAKSRPPEKEIGKSTCRHKSPSWNSAFNHSKKIAGAGCNKKYMYS